MAQVQSDTLVSHSDNIKSNELPTTVISMIREETSAKYTYFAYPEGFFTNSSGDILEPTMVNTGIGNSSDWLLTVVEVDGINYRVHRSPSLNLAGDLMTCKLVQEGYR
jgi:hypothetical protein